LRPLTEVVEVFAELLRKASGIPVHVGWRPASSFPTAVLQLRSAEINPLDMAASKHLVDVSLQLDIWHTSPKACDEAVDRIIQHLEGERVRLAEQLGVLGVYFESVVDVGDSRAFRRMLLVRVRVVGRMCIFRIPRGRKYFCGKRYPLNCSPSICPFGDVLCRASSTGITSRRATGRCPRCSTPTTQRRLGGSSPQARAEYVVKDMSSGLVEGLASFEQALSS
jgi:hypothetical protein